MNLANEPEGWSQLQALAQKASDSQSLALIIDEMNRLLDKYKMDDEAFGNRSIGLVVQDQNILD